ncbi:MAG: hypothetical protein QG580_240 [Patescibacteria group bacterium]|nr:hypothetical protein [Patescibacteria group bacterium]
MVANVTLSQSMHGEEDVKFPADTDSEDSQEVEGGDDEGEDLDPVSKEVGQIFDECGLKALHSIVSRSEMEMAERRPLSGAYDDESPSPKPVKKHVRNVLGVKGKNAGISLLPFPHRPHGK